MGGTFGLIRPLTNRNVIRAMDPDESYFPLTNLSEVDDGPLPYGTFQ